MRVAAWLFFLSISASLHGVEAAECGFNPGKTFLARVFAVGSDQTAADRDAEGDRASLPRLNDREIIVAFVGGPHPNYTDYLLDILKSNCIQATFFFTGRTAIEHQRLVQQVLEAGHTVAASTWSEDAALDKMPVEDAKIEIEKGLSAVAQASGGKAAPFFFAPRQLSPELTAYLSGRDILIWSPDIVSGDREEGNATTFANRALDRIHKAGHGIVEFHETRRVVVDGLDSVLYNLKTEGVKVVHVVSTKNLTAKPEYALPALLATGKAKPSAAASRLVESAQRKVRHEYRHREFRSRLERTSDQNFQDVTRDQ